MEVPLIKWRSQRFGRVDEGMNLQAAQNRLGFFIQPHILYLSGFGFRQGVQSPVEINVSPAEMELFTDLEAGENGEASPGRTDRPQLLK